MENKLARREFLKAAATLPLLWFAPKVAKLLPQPETIEAEAVTVRWRGTPARMRVTGFVIHTRREVVNNYGSPLDYSKMKPRYEYEVDIVGGQLSGTSDSMSITRSGGNVTIEVGAIVIEGVNIWRS